MKLLLRRDLRCSVWMALNVKHLPCRYNGLNLIPPPTHIKVLKKKSNPNTEGVETGGFLGLTAQKVFSNK